jgi:hypothetical protein
MVLQREFRGADPEHDCGMPGSARLVAAAQDNKVWIWKAYERHVALFAHLHVNKEAAPEMYRLPILTITRIGVWLT